MKKVVAVGCLISIFLLACSKQEPANTDQIQETQPHYDTVAIDSFSAGAISVDIARQIRISSQKYQDSIREALKLEQEENRITQELEKETKKKLDAEKKLKVKESSPVTEPSSN